MSDTIQVGQRIRVTRIRPVGSDVVNEGVIAEIEPEGFADNGKPYPPYAVIEDENGKHVTSFPMAYDGKSIEFTETYHVEILEPAPTPSPVDDRTTSVTGIPVESGHVDDSASDHGPLAAQLSDRTLAKVLSRPAYVPPSPTKDAIVEAAIRWYEIRNAHAADVTPLQLFDADDALNMAVKAHHAAVTS